MHIDACHDASQWQRCLQAQILCLNIVAVLHPCVLTAALQFSDLENAFAACRAIKLLGRTVEPSDACDMQRHAASKPRPPAPSSDGVVIAANEV